jgi:hypothetical protein
VSPVRYEMGFYIPEDDILHSHCRENLKSYKEGVLGRYIATQEQRLTSCRQSNFSCFCVSRDSLPVSVEQYRNTEHGNFYSHIFQFMACKLSSLKNLRFQCGVYEECRLLGCDTARILLEPIIFWLISPPS